jgi:Chaperone of endosialidase
MKTLHLRKSIGRSPTRLGLLLIPLALVCLALSPQAGAACEEGCDTNGNTFLGDGALSSTTTGVANTATGSSALFRNTEGSNNTASGLGALTNNTTGSDNTAIGIRALSRNTTANSNTATGANVLWRNTTGYRNTAIGYAALFRNDTGHGNTAVGFQALYQNTGSNNAALGFNAGSNLTDGGGNVCIGYNVLGVAGESNATRISNIYSSVASARPVYINSDNKIGTLVSSRRFKEEIKPMDKASEAILALKPVTFHYKKEIEPNGAIMFGLIAEDVEKVDPDLVTRNEKGEAETVRYEAVNAMLLNEFLKEHRKIEEQGRRTEERGRTIAQQEAEIRALASQLQKVSDELAAASPSRGGLDSIKSAPRVVASSESVNDQSKTNNNFASTNRSESGGDAFSPEMLPHSLSDLESRKYTAGKGQVSYVPIESAHQ